MTTRSLAIRAISDCRWLLTAPRPAGEVESTSRIQWMPSGSRLLAGSSRITVGSLTARRPTPTPLAHAQE